MKALILFVTLLDILAVMRHSPNAMSVPPFHIHVVDTNNMEEGKHLPITQAKLGHMIVDVRTQCTTIAKGLGYKT